MVPPSFSLSQPRPPKLAAVAAAGMGLAALAAGMVRLGSEEAAPEDQAASARVVVPAAR